MKKKVYAIIRKYYHMIGYDRRRPSEYGEKASKMSAMLDTRFSKQARQRMMNNTVLLLMRLTVSDEDGSTT